MDIFLFDHNDNNAPLTDEEIYKEVKRQLTLILMNKEYTIEAIETESREVTEYPIDKLARQVGFENTTEFLQEWFSDLVEFNGTKIRAKLSSVYDNPNLQHLLNLHAQTMQ
uniref:Uncharacterized protein n=1 Tax=Panagrolaimus sp. ES5 TaxID=591445 RepID=A0AC34G3X6_9BILA